MLFDDVVNVFVAGDKVLKAGKDVQRQRILCVTLFCL